MERNKLENQIQEKLISREIQPSAAAWDRLDAMLTIAEEKKTKKSFFSYRWIGIAASVLFFLFIGKYTYDKSTIDEIPNIKNQPTVVLSEKEIPIKEIPISNQIIVENGNSVQNQNPIIKKPKAAVSIITREQSSNWRSNPQLVSNQNQPIAEVFSKEKELPQPFIPQEVVISELKIEQVDHEIQVKKAPSISKIKVNAASLLSQVDSELEQTYRETKLEKITRNLNNVKVALANRNNE